MRRERDALAAERASILERESRLAEREAVLRKRLDAKLNEQLREARAEVDAVVTQPQKHEALAALADGATPRSVSTGHVGELRRKRARALGAIEQADALETPMRPESDALAEAPSEGDRVFVATSARTASCAASRAR